MNTGDAIAMGNHARGIQSSRDNQAAVRNDVYVVASNWFVNRCPLVTRLPRVPVGSTTFTTIIRAHRARVAVLSGSVEAGDSQISLADVSPFMNGDVLELPTGERVELVSDPDLNVNVIHVRRGVEGTTPGSCEPFGVVRLIGNSRTGGEVGQKAVGVSQFCQTWQHPVQVSGSLQASSSFETTKGTRTPFDQYKIEALQNLMDDMECSSYYGRGESPAVSDRPKQKGLRTLLAENLVTNPINADTYKRTDFIRGTLEKCRANGGDPDVLLLSPDFMRGLSVWGAAAHKVDAGVTVFSTPIDVFEVPFLGGVSVIEAPLLRPGTAVCLTSSEVRMRMKRNEFWSPHGSRGDAYEGDWIAEGAIEVDNPGHHAWVEGVTRFAPAL